MFLGESSDHQGNKNRFLANRCPNLSTRRVKWSLIVIENSSKSLDQGRNLPLRLMHIRVLITRTGYSWVLVTRTGYSWILVTRTGYSWVLITRTGYSWVLITRTGYSWLQLVFYKYFGSTPKQVSVICQLTSIKHHQNSFDWQTCNIEYFLE